MAKKTIFSIGSLLIILAVLGVITVIDTSNNLRLDVANNITTFYLGDNSSGTNVWNVGGTEGWGLYNGSTKLVSTNINLYSKIDKKGNWSTVTRITDYGNSRVIDVYQFNASSTKLEDFPVSHDVYLYNVTGLNYKYILFINSSRMNYVVDSKFTSQEGLTYTYSYAPIIKQIDNYSYEYIQNYNETNNTYYNVTIVHNNPYNITSILDTNLKFRLFDPIVNNTVTFSNYTFKTPINCTANDGSIILVNGSNGFTLNSTSKQFVYTQCYTDAKIYWINDSDYVIGNGSTLYPMLVAAGTVSSFNTTGLLGSNTKLFMPMKDQSTSDYNMYGVSAVAGKIGGAYSFSNAPYITFPSSLNDTNIPTTGSFAFWINNAADNKQSFVFVQEGGVGVRGRYAVDLDTRANVYGVSHPLYFQINTVGGAKVWTGAAGSAKDDGLWHHYVIVYNFTANTCIMYVDNVSVAVTQQSNSGTTAIANNVNNCMGTDCGYNGGPFGTFSTYIIDDFRIYNTTITASDVSNLYNSGSGSPREDIARTNMVAHISMDAGYDWSGTATPTMTAVSYSSLYGMGFDGSSSKINLGAPSGLSFGNGGTDQPFSVFYVANHTSLSDYQSYIAKYSASGYEYYDLIYADGHSFFSLLKDASTYIGRTTGAGMFVVGVPNFITETYSATKTNAGIKIYSNAIQKDTGDLAAGSYTGMTASSSPAEIGIRSGVSYLNSKIYNYFIYSTNKSQREINNSYQNYLNTAGYGNLLTTQTNTGVADSVTFISQVPSDITTTSLINTTSLSLNVTYNIAILNLNTSSPYLNYTLTSPIRSCWEYNNGTCTTPINTTITSTYNQSLGSQNNSNYSFLRTENDIYPESAPLDLDYFRNNTYQTQLLSGSNNYAVLEDYAFLNTTTANLLEISMTTSSGSYNIYISNTSGKFSTLPANSYTLIGTQGTTNSPLFHCHSGVTKCDQVFSFGITKGKINNVTTILNTTMYIYVVPVGNSAGTISYITVGSRSTQFQTTSNGGNSFTPIVGTAATHIHQYYSSNLDVFNYNVCGKNSSNTQVCSSQRSDNLDITVPPPSAGTITSPSTGYYNANSLVNISYTAASVSNLSVITYYNITLYNSSFGLNTTIINNNSVNLNYSWNISLVPDGSYYIGVTAYDNQTPKQSVTWYSDLITIDKTNPIITIYGDSPTNGSVVYNHTVRIDYLVTDTNFANSTFYLYNSTYGLVYNLTSVTTAVNTTTELAPHGIYYYNITTVDLANNSNKSNTIMFNLTPCIDLYLVQGLDLAKWNFGPYLRWNEFANSSGGLVYYSYYINGTGIPLTGQTGNTFTAVVGTPTCLFNAQLLQNLSTLSPNKYVLNLTINGNNFLLNDTTIFTGSTTNATNWGNLTLNVYNVFIRYSYNATNNNNTYINSTDLRIRLRVA